MDFTIDKLELIAALDKCILAVPDAKHPTEAFRVMTVTVKNLKKQKINFAAVGEMCTVDTVAPGEPKTTGQFIVYPKQLHAIASHMPPGKIRFSLKGTRITVQSVAAKGRRASFENMTTQVNLIEDPGEGAAWVEMRTSELVRALKMVKAASQWEDSGKPVNSVLIPSPQGLQVFGCNGYLITLAQSSIPVADGQPIQMPATAFAVLQLMQDQDDNVHVFSDSSRIYLESCDTLVSAPLNDEPNMKSFPHMIELLNGEASAGPVFSPKHLQDGVKAVLSGAGFAGDLDKKGARGYQLKTFFGDKIVVELALSNADARDEFEAEETAEAVADLDFRLSSRFLEQLLGGLTGVERVRALRISNLLVLRSQGVTAGIMEERPES